ncbi:VENN motif pre-toxin domain-containing protein [Erwinia persicina]|uniref:VENN motif pre-toxin domain-containing protein n=1 Tax=Erwinia persicina TaxID=55211 RepID=UPI0039AF3E26
MSKGTIVIRDPATQQLEVEGLSRDVEHANQTLSLIFSKEKEQRRLQEAQLIGEIGGQAMDVIRTQGDIAGLKAQTDPAALALAREQLAKDGKPTGSAAVMQRAYDNAMRQYGTGSDLQKAAQAVTGALTALAGNNLAGALASGASPYLATEIRKLTTNPLTGKVDVASNAMAHAVLGAVTAQLNNQSAVAGGLGAGGGELAARYIAGQLFPGRAADQLSESEKQQVSALSELAAGVAGGLATGDTGGAVTAGQAGKNAVENNALSLPTGLMNYGQAVASWDQYAQDNNLTPEQKQAGLDKLAQGDLPEGANITKVIVNGYKDGVLIAGAAYLGPAASVGKAVGGAVIAEIANGSYQWFDLSQPGNENKTWDYKGSLSTGITGALAPGRGVWQNVGMAAGGSVFTDGPDIGSVGGAALGAWAGGKFGELAPFPGEINDLFGGIGGEIISNKVKDKINEN